MTENFFCYLLLQLKLRRLETTLTSGVGRKALRQCLDISRKRDGIVVSALSFLPPPLYEDSSNIDEVHRSIGRTGFYVAPVAVGDISGAQWKAYRTSDAPQMSI